MERSILARDRSEEEKREKKRETIGFGRLPAMPAPQGNSVYTRAGANGWNRESCAWPQHTQAISKKKEEKRQTRTSPEANGAPGGTTGSDGGAARGGCLGTGWALVEGSLSAASASMKRPTPFSALFRAVICWVSAAKDVASASFAPLSSAVCSSDWQGTQEQNAGSWIRQKN